ncbi:excinuclease ABC subunit C [Flavipsychrobacter stenotrophus]|uniref:Excinuclease ABC subunit C n=1 Tax=Flavipsychrobacter stenotrophus TaxID=2077091 RepID=A0A2S7ST10_9BACT|nr:GIY-YIG nuclease family protein [Flavipsychrobacter stenotrophus]PQJ09874.1 excinuclease ABC subunit C [Flavipsychrobacter stenotrophus]
MEFTVYILYSFKTDKYYIGHTGNMDDRLMRHNGGRSTATKSGVPWLLKYTEKYASKTDAYRREMEIKAWKSRKMIESLIFKHSSAGSEHPDH